MHCPTPIHILAPLYTHCILWACVYPVVRLGSFKCPGRPAALLLVIKAGITRAHIHADNAPAHTPHKGGIMCVWVRWNVLFLVTAMQTRRGQHRVSQTQKAWISDHLEPPLQKLSSPAPPRRASWRTRCAVSQFTAMSQSNEWWVQIDCSWSLRWPGVLLLCINNFFAADRTPLDKRLAVLDILLLCVHVCVCLCVCIDSSHKERIARDDC